MAYVQSNPPRKVLAGGIDNSQGGANLWFYTSADAKTTVDDAGYFTDALQLGMAVNDLVFVVDTATPLISCHRVKSFTGNAANLSAGTDIGATA